MTTATLEALMKVYGILLREGWDDSEAEGGRPDGGDRSEADVKASFLDPTLPQHTPDEVREVVRVTGRATAGHEVEGPSSAGTAESGGR